MKPKAVRIQELLDYIEPIAKESREIVFPGGKLADDWSDEQDERLACCLAEETRVAKEIRKICEEPPGDLAPSELQQFVDAELQQCATSTKESIRFSKNVIRSANHSLQASAEATALSRMEQK